MLPPEIQVMGKPYLKVVVSLVVDAVRFDNILIKVPNLEIGVGMEAIAKGKIKPILVEQVFPMSTPKSQKRFCGSSEEKLFVLPI